MNRLKLNFRKIMSETPERQKSTAEFNWKTAKQDYVRGDLSHCTLIPLHCSDVDCKTEIHLENPAEKNRGRPNSIIIIIDNV